MCQEGVLYFIFSVAFFHAPSQNLDVTHVAPWPWPCLTRKGYGRISDSREDLKSATNNYNLMQNSLHSSLLTGKPGIYWGSVLCHKDPGLTLLYSKHCCAVAVMQKEQIFWDQRRGVIFGNTVPSGPNFLKLCAVEDVWGRDDDTSSSYHSSIHVWIIIPAKH